MDLLAALLIVFTIFVGCPWVILHYRTMQKKTGDLSVQDYQRIQELNDIAERMSSRIQALESILDNETPDWRNRYNA